MRFYTFLLLFITTIATAQTLTLSPEIDIKYSIEQAKAGDILLLKGEHYFTEGKIKVPSEVTLSGNKDTLITQMPAFGNPFFDLSGTYHVTLKNFSIALNAGEKGIVAQGALTQDLNVSHIVIKGNLDQKLSSKMEQSNIAIYLQNLNKANLANLEITNTVGGIYVAGNAIFIHDNKLNRVNLGNIVATGDTIHIIKNIILEPGKGWDFEPAHGDGITLGEGRNILIKDNTFTHGHCYMLWATSIIENLIIEGNIVKSSITTGFNINHANNVQIKNNIFISNLANGLNLTQGSDIVIENNRFYGNPLLINQNVTNILVKNNSFEAYNYGEKALKVSKQVQVEDNTFNYLDKAVSPELILTTDTGRQVNSGDLIEITSRKTKTMAFKITNKGNQTLSFFGAPIILLAKEVLSSQDFRPNLSGSAIFEGFAIPASIQPMKRTLAPEESTHFSIQLTQGNANYGKLVTVNIPTLHDIYKPFWFRVKQV